MNKRKLLTVLSIASVAVLSSVTFADEITPS
ncbi:TPA: cell wall anchor protein, partial [Streptococcus agalactiae]|nr:cell wall anchor protein [Streptococcus agalactiae]